MQTPNIVIYNAPNGSIELKAKLKDDTLWLTQEEIAHLFEVQRPAITKHIKNIFATEELQEKSVCSILELTARDGKKYKTKLYNLDLILSVGYRVNSKSATQFRIWATNVLKQYLTQGYSLNKQILLEQQSKAQSLQQAIGWLSRLAVQGEGSLRSAVSVLESFSKGLSLLDDYDHKKLDEQGSSVVPAETIHPEEFLELINYMKPDFASEVFGRPKDGSFESSIRQIYQTFDGKPLYPSIEQKAAELLYLIVKNHAFADGNKRIAAACFLYFLEKNHILFRESGIPVIDNKALATLTLLIAVSTPSEKDTILQVILSVLNR